MVEPLWETVWHLSRLNIELPYNHVALLRVNENVFTKYSHMNVYSSIIASNQKVETMQVTTDEWINKIGIFIQ